jgi:hypothetical protein
LKPGGYIDVSEYEVLLHCDDGTLSETSYISRYYSLLNEAANKSGQEFRIAAHLDSLLDTAGFAGVHHEVVKLPLGGWAAEKKQKEIGAYMMLCTEHGFEAFGMALLTRVLEMSVSEVEELIKGAKKEVHSRKIHVYNTQYDSFILFPSFPVPSPFYNPRPSDANEFCSGTCTTGRSPRGRWKDEHILPPRFSFDGRFMISLYIFYAMGMEIAPGGGGFRYVLGWPMVCGEGFVAK